MNRTLTLPLFATTAALVLALGTISAQADSLSPGSSDTRSDQAEQRASAAAAEGAARIANAADEAGEAAAGTETHTAAAGDSNESAPSGARSDDVAAKDADQMNVDPIGADSGESEIAADAEAVATDATARSRSFTKSIVTPHMAMSITHSIGLTKDDDGDMAMAKAMAKAQALDTPGVTRTDTRTKTTIKVEGDAEADATATANADVDETGMSVATFGETSVAVH